MAERIQRKRTKGWRMPAEAVYVWRGTKWGNPYRVGCTVRICCYELLLCPTCCDAPPTSSTPDP